MKKVKQIEYGKEIICLILSIISLLVLIIADIRALVTADENIDYSFTLYSMSLMFCGIIILVVLAITIFSYVRFIKYHQDDLRYKRQNTLDKVIFLVNLVSIILGFITYIILNMKK